MRSSIGWILAFGVACGGASTTSTQPPAPSAPTGLVATAGNGEIALTWTPVSDATNYLVLRSDQSGGAKTQIGATAVPSFVDGGLPSGKTGFYVVRAVGSGGTSADSAEVRATSAVEPAPSNVVAKGGIGQISLTWDVVPQATGYVVFRSDIAGAVKTQVSTPSTNSYTDAGLGAGVAAFYVVRSIGPAGTSNDSIEVGAVTALETAPTGLVAAGGDTQIALSWNPVADAAGYLVFGGDGAGGPKVQIGAPSTPAFVENGLASGMTRFYVVRAVGAAGTSAESDAVSARSNVQPVPQGLSAVAANAIVSLSWSPVAGASYRVFRANGSGGAVQIGFSDSTSFTDTMAGNGIVYAYTVSSVGAAGVSVPSSPASAQPFRDLCVTDSSLNQVLVFNAEKSSGTLPSRTFGSRTGLSSFGIAVDPAHGEIFSANVAIDSVTSHLESQTGNAPPQRTITATFPAAVAYDPTDDELIVSAGGVLQTFARSADGAAVPVRSLGLFADVEHIVLTGPDHGDWMFLGDGVFVRAFHRKDTGTPPLVPSTAILDGISALAYDPVDDQLLVANGDGVTAYSISSNGFLTPVRSLRSGVVGISPTGLAVDAAAGVLHVANFAASVVTFPLDFPDNPQINPTTVLSGPDTGLSFANNKVTFDPVQHTVIVQSARRLLVFDANDSGDAKPLSVISADDTGIDNPGGIAFDPASRQLLVLNENAGFTVDGYDRAAAGDVQPASTFRVHSSNDTFFSENGVALDVRNSEIDVALTALPGVAFFARDAAGAAAPLRTIVGLIAPAGIAADAAADAVVVSDRAGVIYKFARTTTLPLASIAGDQTGLSAPSGVFVDEAHGEIVVADVRSVLVFRLGDDGNVAPVRQLALPDGAGEDVLVDPATDEMFVLSAFGIQVYARTATGNDQPLRTLVPNGSGQLFNATRMTVCN